VLTWVRSYENSGDYLESVDGIAWHDAPLPLSLHPCMPQTRGRIGGHYVERCACGALRDSPRGRWSEVNRTRRDRRRARRRAAG
jgi:hypothetical protein